MESSYDRSEVEAGAHAEVRVCREAGPACRLAIRPGVVSVAAALAITHSLERYTTLRTPLFYIAIIISAWFGGLGPGLLAVTLSTVLVDYYFAPGGADTGMTRG